MIYGLPTFNVFSNYNFSLDTSHLAELDDMKIPYNVLTDERLVKIDDID